MILQNALGNTITKSQKSRNFVEHINRSKGLRLDRKIADYFNPISKKRDVLLL